MKDCLTCANYYVFYTKDRDHFKRERQGFCDLNKKVVQNHDNCEKWRNNYWKRTVIKKISAKTLTSAIKNLSEIKQILFEEQEESNDNPFPNKQ